MAVGSIYLTGLTIPPAPAVNAAAGAQQRTLSAAADRSVIPLIYGQVQATADVLNIIEHATDPNAYLLQVKWCHACDSIATPLLNGLALPSGGTFTHYTGSQTTADAALVAAFAAKGITYTDTLQGIAYSVLKLPVKEFTGELTVTAVVRGRKVYDPRKDSTAGGSGLHRLASPSTWEWSDNPALCLADWIDSATYGADDAIVWTSVPAAANANDALVGTGPTEKRRTLNLAINDPVRIADMAEAMRAYAGCWLVPTRYGISLLPDADNAEVATYSHTSGQIAAIGSIATRDLSNSPTAVEVTYTDDSQTPSRDGTALAALPGAGSTLPWRQSSVRLPGINRYSQALREATERLNKLNLGAYSTTLDVFDIGIRHEIGDIIRVSHPAGLVNAPMRITDAPQMPRIGHWRLPVTQHDPLAYDNGVYTTPGYGDPGRIVAAGPPSNVTGFSGSAGRGLIRWRWEPCLDVDYGVTEVRTSDANWGDAANFVPAFRGRVNEWQEQVTAPGTYTRYIRHYDETGLYSVNVATGSVVVTDADLSSEKSTLRFTPAFGLLTQDATGRIANFGAATTRVQVLDPSGADVTAAWTTTKADTGIATTLSSGAKRTLTVTGYSAAVVAQNYNNLIILDRFNGGSNDESPYDRGAPEKGALAVYQSSGGPFPGTGYVQFPASAASYRADNKWIRYQGGNEMAAVDTNWSMSSWVRMDEIPQNLFPILGNSVRELNIYGGTWNATNTKVYFAARWFMWFPNSTGNYTFSVNIQTSLFTIATGVWFFLELAWDNTDKKMRLFLNGELIGTSTTTPSNISPSVICGDSPYSSYSSYNYWQDFKVGANFDGGYAYGLIGGMAEVAFQIGGSVPTASYTAPTAQRLLSSAPSVTYTDVTAVDGSGSTLTGRYEVYTQTGNSDEVLLVPSQASGQVVADWDGSNPDYSGAHVTFKLYVNGIDKTNEWVWYGNPDASPSDIASTMSNGVLTITGGSFYYPYNQAQVIEVLAGKAGYVAKTYRYTVTRLLRPKPTQVPSISRASITLSGDSNGNVSSFVNASGAVKVMEGATDATTTYTWTRTATSGISTSGTPQNNYEVVAISASVDTGTITMTGKKSGWPDVVISCQVAKTRAAPAVVKAAAAKGALLLAGDWQGVVSDYSPAATDISILVDGVESATLWTLTPTYSVAGLTGTITGARLQITAMPNASSIENVLVTATRSGFPDQAIWVTVAKSFAPKPTQVPSQTKTLIQLAGDSNGAVTNFTSASFAGAVVEGTVDRTADYTWSFTATSGLTATRSGSIVFVTAIANTLDAATIVLTGTKSGWPDVVLTCQVAKTRTLVPQGFIGFDRLYAYGSGTTTAPLMEFALRSNGTLEQRQGGAGAWTPVGNWYYPTVSGAGTGRFVKAVGTVNAPSGYVWPTAWTSLASDVVLSVTNGQMDASLLFSNSATGATILGNGSVLLASSVDAP